MKKHSHELLLCRESSLSTYVGSSALLAVGLCAVFASIGISSAGAATIAWDGGAAGTATTLNTAANWAGDVAPSAATDVALFDGTVAASPLVLDWAGAFGSTSTGVSLSISGAQMNPVNFGNSTNSGNLSVGNITVDSGAGAVTIGDGAGNEGFVFRSSNLTIPNVLTNNSSNPVTFATGVVMNHGTGTGSRLITIGGSGNWVFNNSLVLGGAGFFNFTKTGSGTLTFTFPNAGGNHTFTVNEGTMAIDGAGLLGTGGNYTRNITNNATFAFNSTGSQTLSGVMSGSGAVTQSAGTLIFSGANSYTGATTVTGGSFKVSGTSGSINSTSGVTINGATARYVHNASDALTPALTLTQGTLDGTASVGAVTVSDSTANVIAHGDGGTGSLTLGNLTFQGDATLSVAEDGNTSTAPFVVSGALVTTPASGSVKINASLPFWSSGVTYNVLSFGSFSGNASHFNVGTVSGLTSRQSATIVNENSSIGLQINGDTPKWTGSSSSVWSTSATGNWQLILGGGSTTFINGDLALFDDSAANTAVNIATNVSPALVRFDNSSQNYTLSGAAGIAAGSLTKDGSANVTISTPNSYDGGTTINAGTLTLVGSGTLGGASGGLTVNNGTLDLGGTSQTLATATLTGSGTIQNGTLTTALSGTGTSGTSTVTATLTGGSTVTMNGAGGTLLLSGVNDYTGGTTVSAGTLALGGVGTLGGAASPVTVGAGTLDLGTGSLALGAVTLSGSGVVQNGNLSATSITATNTSGIATVAAAVTGATQVVRNGAGGILALTGANTYTGGTTVTAGTLQLGNATTTGSIAPFSPITVAAGAVFAVNRTVDTVQGTDFGPVTGAGGFTQNGTGFTTLNVANSYTGTTTATAGRIHATASGALGTGLVNLSNLPTRLQVSNGITLANAINTGGNVLIENLSGDNTLSGNINFANVGNTTTTIAPSGGTLRLTGSISTTLNTASRTFIFGTPGGSPGTVIASGVISDGSAAPSFRVGVTKSGSGTLILGGNNTYTGTTTVNTGILRVDGALGLNGSGVSSDVTVNSSGTLAGRGVIAGNTSVLGTLRPAAGATGSGSLTFNGAVTLDGASTTTFDLAGVIYSGVNFGVSSTVNYGGTLRLNFLGGVYNGTYNLLTAAGTPGGTFSSVTLTTTGETDTPLVADGSIWSLSSVGINYVFNASTGVLTVTGGATAVTPGSATLSATAGNASVNLSWTAATNADSYIVQRAAAPGGPYTVIENGVGGLGYSDNAVTNDVTYYYVIQPRDSASGLTGPVSNEVATTPVAPISTALQTWRLDQFGVNEDTAEVLAGDDEDFDGDGQVNLLEYALGTDPKTATASPVTVSRSGNLLTLTYPVRTPADPALSYGVLGSDNLTTAFIAATGATVINGSTATYTDNVDLSAAGGRRFLRLSVTYTAP
jgi:autotransporter-associated beta strand protein